MIILKNSNVEFFAILKSMKLFIISIAILAIIAGFVFIPVKSSDAPCGLGERYSIVKGQQNAYEEAARNADNIHMSCPQDMYDFVPNTLYIF